MPSPRLLHERQGISPNLDILRPKLIILFDNICGRCAIDFSYPSSKNIYWPLFWPYCMLVRYNDIDAYWLFCAHCAASESIDHYFGQQSGLLM